MKKTKEQKAITLIALIITIVVLLILAVVAIRAVTGDGIIAHAKNAQTKYEDAQNEENHTLSVYEEYLIEQTGWQQNGTKVSKEGTTLNVGDYVNYESGVSGYADMNGWAVLGAKNGKILLVSTNLPNKLTLTGYKDAITKLNKACEGYDIGEHAVKGSARSINVEDINRITGYNPLKTGDGTIYEAGTRNQYQNKVTYTMDNNGKIYYELEVTGADIDKSGECKAVSSCIDINGKKLEKNSSITITADHYGYNPISLILNEDNSTTNVRGISIDSNAYKFLFSNTGEGKNPYWLASIATMLNNAHFGWAEYGTRLILDGKILTKILSYSIEGQSDKSGEYGVRAVITLESDVNLTYDTEQSIWRIS